LCRSAPWSSRAHLACCARRLRSRWRSTVWSGGAQPGRMGGPGMRPVSTASKSERGEVLASTRLHAARPSGPCEACQGGVGLNRSVKSGSERTAQAYGRARATVRPAAPHCGSCAPGPAADAGSTATSAATPPTHRELGGQAQQQATVIAACRCPARSHSSDDVGWNGGLR